MARGTNGLQKLYHQTLAIRPKLIKLIEKYSQKKGMMILSAAGFGSVVLIKGQMTSPS